MQSRPAALDVSGSHVEALDAHPRTRMGTDKSTVVLNEGVDADPSLLPGEHCVWYESRGAEVPPSLWT